MLEKKALRIRKRILDMARRSGSAHVGSCLSCVDILTFLYFHEMRFGQSVDNSHVRDRFLMSKGHGAMALYAVLSEKKIIDPALTEGYMIDGGTLPAHLDRFSADGIEISAGSLGHGLSMALGLSHGFKMKNNPSRVLVLMGDGEIQEGSVWEAAMLAPVLKLDNLTALIDYNNLQGYGRPRDLVYFEPLREKWEAFGWDVVETDGHDFDGMKRVFSRSQAVGRPRVIICHTVKGKGVSFMEDQLKWHYFVVTDERYALAMRELENVKP